MTIKKTFQKRGKSPIPHDRLQPHGVYAVEYQLPKEIAIEYGVVSIQLGLVHLDDKCHVLRHYNMEALNKWSEAPIDINELTLWPTTQMERDFVYTHQLNINLSHRLSMVEIDNRIQKDALTYYKTDRLHRLVEHIYNFFKHA